MQIEQIIKDVYLKYGYVVDPHTARGFEQGFEGKEIILATAHPKGNSPTRFRPPLERKQRTHRLRF